MNQALKFTEFLKDLGRISITERPNQAAAGLAFFGMFSLAPALYIVFTVAGLFIDAPALMDRGFAQLETALGTEIAELIRELVEGLNRPSDEGSKLLSVVGFFALLYAASSFFFQLQFALNRIWGVPPPRRKQARSYIMQRMFSFLVVLVLGLVLVALAFVYLIGTWLGSLLNLGAFDTRLGIPVFVLVTAVAFALLYKVLPDVGVSWRSVWLGAGIASSLATLGGALVVWLLASGRIGSGLAAAGAFVVVLLLIYFITQIFLFGAIISREHAHRHEGGAKA